MNCTRITFYEDNAMSTLLIRFDTFPMFSYNCTKIIIIIIITIIIPSPKTPMRARAGQKTAEISHICPQTCVNNYPANLITMCGQHGEIIVFLIIPDCNYHDKSIATQIFQDSGLAPISVL